MLYLPTLALEEFKLIPNQTKQLTEKVADVLDRGGIIIYPTDTVYGLGVDATNAQAVMNIYMLKGRMGKGMASIYQSIKAVQFDCQLSRKQEQLLRKYLPGPYTFLLKPEKNTSLAPRLIDRERGTVGVRIPNHPFTRELAKQFGKPFTTTSANRSGLPESKTIEDVDKHFLNEIISRRVKIRSPRGCEVIIIDGNQLPGQPSTVVDLTKTPPEVVRQGAGEWSSE